MASSGTKTVALVLAVAVLCAVAGGWAWGEHARRELRRSAGALVHDATAGLREGLQARAAADAADARKLDADAAALDARLADFERMKPGRDPALAFAAEEYALSARQILRESAREARARRAVEERLRELSGHMNYANRRTAEFHRTALALKDALEKAYYDYRLAADGLARELDGLAEARAKVAARLGTAPLLDEASAAEARGRAAENARRVADAMQRARRMAGGR
jgi:hypothetical protein